MLNPHFRGIPLKYVAGDGTDITEDDAGKRLHARRRRRFAQDVRSISREGLARNLSFAALRQRIRGRHCFCTSTSAFEGEEDGGRHDGGRDGATDRHGVGHHGAHGRIQHRRSARGTSAAHRMPISEMAAACIASMGKSIWTG